MFISGYLSYKLFREISYAEFIIKKIKNIGFPYISFSVMITAISFVKYKITGVHWHAAPYYDSFQKFIDALINGSVQGAYWYMPFILTVFLFTPPILRLNKNALYTITLISLVIPVLFPRTYHTQTFKYCFYFTYFVPGFLLGMLSCACRDKILEFIRSHLFILTGIFIISTISCCFIDFFYKYTNNEQIPLYITKASSCLLIYYYLHQVKFSSALLGIIAQNSFTIYFIHLIIIDTVFWRIFNPIMSSGDTLANFLLAFSVSSISVIVACLTIAMTMRAVMKNKARYFIG